MIAVIIPCYKAKKHILNLLHRLNDEVTEIILVDDFCPEKTGFYVQENYTDSRLKIIFHTINKGVGGAMKTGFAEALKGKATIFIKLDSDGQMAPEIMNHFTLPILNGNADCCKGNRFYNLESLRDMPATRLFGNSVLSFYSKLSCGYWHVMDPTNGYIAIHRKIIEHLPVDKLDDRYFFETTLLFRLNIMNAVIVDIPMNSTYEDEESNLSVGSSFYTFFIKNIQTFFKRIFYSYVLRDFNIASLNLILGAILFGSGLIYGITNFYSYQKLAQETPGGVQILTAILLIIGFQLLLAFITYDMSKVPTRIMHDRLPDKSDLN